MKLSRLNFMSKFLARGEPMTTVNQPATGIVESNRQALALRNIMWIAAALALFAALSYVLINASVLAVGDVPHEEGSTSIAYVAAGCYLLGGLLILLRRRWLWISGLVMNTLVLLFFFQMYQGRPIVIFSPGGLATKIAQVLLEVCLIYLILADWRKARR
jgi:hypothetical protein